MRIMLACALGMSTGMLMEKMRDYAKSQGKDYKIWAVSADSVDNYTGEFDILLLGPQVLFLYEDVKKKFAGIAPVAMIAPVDYGRMNGKAVILMAEKLWQEYQDKKAI